MVNYDELFLYGGLISLIIGVLITLIFGAIAVFADNDDTWIMVLIIIGVILIIVGILMIIAHFLFAPHEYKDDELPNFHI